ncbi:MAG TPA: dCMP deaminase family protein [Nitrososphaeraceae archaeon]|nr:dCMP deaminase family protein [Nitrososphaeraceae archaeon]
MMTTISWDEYFIQVAKLISKRSSCLVKQFGAVITKNNRIISTGYNGTPSQFLNCNQGGCERCGNRIKGKIKTGEQLEKCLCIHAEASAILQNSKECQGSTLYVTGEPCIQCAKLILSVGIQRVVCFEGQYIDNGVFLLNKKSKDGKKVIVERYK